MKGASMKGRVLNLIILLATLVAPPGLLFAALGSSVTKGSLVWLGLLGGGLLGGNIVLWRYAARERYLRAGWLLLKGLLFNAGWTLATGLLISASLIPSSAPASPAGMTAPRQEPPPVEKPAPSAAPEVAAPSDQQKAAQMKAERYREMLKQLGLFENQLKSAQPEAGLTQRIGPLLERTQRARKQLAAELEQLQRQAPSSGVKQTPEMLARLKAERYREMLQAMESFETQFQGSQPEAGLTQYISPLLEQAQRTREEIAAELERLQRQASAPGRSQTPDKITDDRPREQRTEPPAQSTNPAPAPPAPAVPLLWRYLLCALGFIMAAAGLITADETFIGPLLRAFPFFKSEERKTRENAQTVFDRVKQLLQEEEVGEALAQSQGLETQWLSPAQRQEAEFYHAYATFQVSGADAALPLLEKQHRQFPDFRPTTYLLGYAYLSAERHDRARPVWEQMHGQAPDYLQTKYHFSCALLAQARQLMREAKVNQALPLFKIVRELGIHADAVPEGLHNARLMEAAGKLRAGDARGAEAIFAQAERDGRADKTPEGARLEALGKLGYALVAIHEGRGENAAQSLDELLETFHKLTEVDRPPECTPEKLQTPLAEGKASPLKFTTPAAEDNEAKDGDEKANGEEKSKAAAQIDPQDRELLRDLHFLRGVAQLTAWIRASALQRPNPKDDQMRDALLSALRRALHFDPAFADALAIYGFVLYFYGSNRSAATFFLKQARNAGFEEEALITLLQRIEQLSQIRARTKTEILDRLHEYFTNEEVRRQLKEKLLEEEAIRNGYRDYHGAIQLDDVGERQPTLADLTARSAYLGEEIKRIIAEWMASGTEQQRVENIQRAMANLKKKNEEITKVKEGIEEDENTVLRESGVFVLSSEF
jgi:hypothetical protein